MLSMIEVQCPHCGARGQIMLPPVGSIIIGPCPQCKELVVVFCGQVLPLDKQIMANGSLEERRDHLLSTLTEFLHDRVTKLMTEAASAGEESMADNFDLPSEKTDDGAEPRQRKPLTGEDPITQQEFDRFTEVDLKLLDNRAYFRSVFDQK